jgi:hypothetical protein
MSGSELAIILPFAGSELSPEEIAKLSDGGAALRGKPANRWQQAQTANPDKRRRSREPATPFGPTRTGGVAL